MLTLLCDFRIYSAKPEVIVERQTKTVLFSLCQFDRSFFGGVNEAICALKRETIKTIKLVN